MEISGNLLFNGLSSYQSGQRRIDEAGASIASNSLPRPDNSQVMADRQDLTDSVVQLKVGEVSAQVGVNVIRTADEVLGTLIDTHA